MGDSPTPHHVIDMNPLSMGYGYMPLEGLKANFREIITYTVGSILIYAGVKLVCKAVGRIKPREI